MKKLILVFILVSFIITLSSCKSCREIFLAPPDEMEIPEGSLVATCIVDEVEYKHIYKGDGIYQYFINGIEQDENAVDVIQEQAFLHGESVENYLIDEYGVSGCSTEEYVDTEKE